MQMHRRQGLATTRCGEPELLLLGPLFFLSLLGSNYWGHTPPFSRAKFGNKVSRINVCTLFSGPGGRRFKSSLPDHLFSLSVLETSKA